MEDLLACHCCGLVHRVPRLGCNRRARCVRCASTIKAPGQDHLSRSRTAAVTISALMLYPWAVGLPMLEIEQFGHRSDASIVQAIVSLFDDGAWIVALIVLLCSILLPLGKLAALLILATDRFALSEKHRAWTYRLVEWTGRWGMLDVLLVAVLVAVMKLGSSLTVSPGPAVFLFAMVVLLSLMASAVYDPHSLWRKDGTTREYEDLTSERHPGPARPDSGDRNE